MVLIYFVVNKYQIDLLYNVGLFCGLHISDWSLI